MKNGVGAKSWEENLQIRQIKPQHQQQPLPLPVFNYLNLQDNKEILTSITRSERKFSTEVEDTAALCGSDNFDVKASTSKSSLLETGDYKEISLNQLPPHSGNQVGCSR